MLTKLEGKFGDLECVDLQKLALHKNERRRASGASVPHSTWSAALRDCQIGILANCIICRDFSKGCHRAVNMGDTRGAKLHNANLPQEGSTEVLCKASKFLYVCTEALFGHFMAHSTTHRQNEAGLTFVLRPLVSRSKTQMRPTVGISICGRCWNSL